MPEKDSSSHPPIQGFRFTLESSLATLSAFLRDEGLKLHVERDDRLGTWEVRVSGAGQQPARGTGPSEVGCGVPLVAALNVWVQRRRESLARAKRAGGEGLEELTDPNAFLERPDLLVPDQDTLDQDIELLLRRAGGRSPPTLGDARAAFGPLRAWRRA